MSDQRLALVREAAARQAKQPVSGNKASVFRGDQASVAASASLLSDSFDKTFEKQVKPSTAAERLEIERANAMQQGYQDGILAAKAEVEAALEDANVRVKRLLAALGEAVNDFDQRQTVALHEVEDVIAAGALAIAESVLQREIASATDPGAEAIARALKLAPESGDVVARLHPDDVTTLSMDSIEVTGRQISVVGDPEIEPGGAVLMIGDLRIDAQVSSALKSVRRALRV